MPSQPPRSQRLQRVQQLQRLPHSRLPRFFANWRRLISCGSTQYDILESSSDCSDPAVPEQTGVCASASHHDALLVSAPALGYPMEDELYLSSRPLSSRWPMADNYTLRHPPPGDLADGQSEASKDLLPRSPSSSSPLHLSDSAQPARHMAGLSLPIMPRDASSLLSMLLEARQQVNASGYRLDSLEQQLNDERQKNNIAEMLARSKMFDERRKAHDEKLQLQDELHDQVQQNWRMWRTVKQTAHTQRLQACELQELQMHMEVLCMDTRQLKRQLSMATRDSRRSLAQHQQQTRVISQPPAAPAVLKVHTFQPRAPTCTSQQSAPVLVDSEAALPQAIQQPVGRPSLQRICSVSRAVPLVQ